MSHPFHKEGALLSLHTVRHSSSNAKDSVRSEVSIRVGSSQTLIWEDTSKNRIWHRWNDIYSIQVWQSTLFVEWVTQISGDQG